MRSHFLRRLILLSVFITVGITACKNRQRTEESTSSSFDSKDPSVFRGIEDKFSIEDMDQWKSYLESAEKDPVVIGKTMEAAAKEFKVPVELLKAIGQVETNWTQIGPSIDRGWGIMHLTENKYSDNLGRAAELLKISREDVRNNGKDNIRGMAALLADAASPEVKKSKKLEDWFNAVKATTGLDGNDLQTRRAITYYNVLKKGVKSKTIFDTYVEIAPVKNLNLKVTMPPQPEAGAEYPEAVADYIPCNYSTGRSGQTVDTWTNHWIGVGSAEGARSWFKNCDAQASAHFVVHNDGTVYQLRPTTDSTWHAGTSKSGFPHNNHRSIGVEHEVTTTHPEKWNSEALLNASTKLANYYITKYNIPREHVSGDNNKPGIRGHQEMPGTSTQCPGPLPWDHWLAKLGVANSGSTAGTTPQGTGKLIGIIYQGGDTMNRIAGATVKLNTGASTTSDDKGIYSFANLPAGTYTVTASVDGKGERTLTREVSDGEIWGSIGF